MIRKPAVAGRFYPDDPEALLKNVRSHLEQHDQKVSALGVVAPHAGFMYSGDVAGSVYSRIEIPDRIILLGPNHTGQGQRISVMAEGKWSMPFGDIGIDAELAGEILKQLPAARPDELAHQREHSLETQLPFLQYYRKDFRIVPICLMRLNWDQCRELGSALAKAIQAVQGPVLLVASSDMTHYESHDDASRQDGKAIDRILDLDPQGLFDTVHTNQISMCGVNPATAMLVCSRELGATRAELSRYMTSGEVSGDMNHVVGYAGVIVT